MPTPPTKKARHSMQDFSLMLDYFTPTEWKVLQAGDANIHAKRDVIFTRALQLGCRCPSEPTYKLWVCFWLFLTEPPDRLLTIPGTIKAQMLQSLKQEFKRWTRKASAPSLYLEALPPSPAMMKHHHPQSFQQAFPSEEPCPCKVDAKQVLLLDTSFRCRGSGACSSSTASSLVPVVDLSASPSNPIQHIEHMATGFMQSMCKMQEAMMFMMSGGGRGPSPHGQLRSLSALADLQPVGDVSLLSRSGSSGSCDGFGRQPSLAQLQSPGQLQLEFSPQHLQQASPQLNSPLHSPSPAPQAPSPASQAPSPAAGSPLPCSTAQALSPGALTPVAQSGELASSPNGLQTPQTPLGHASTAIGATPLHVGGSSQTERPSLTVAEASIGLLDILDDRDNQRKEQKAIEKKH